MEIHPITKLIIRSEHLHLVHAESILLISSLSRHFHIHTKLHLGCVITNVKLTFEEFSTILTQVAAYLNSWPLTLMSAADDHGIQVLTTSHFLIGKPLVVLPDPSFSYKSVSLIRHWHLCQNLVCHFW